MKMLMSKIFFVALAGVAGTLLRYGAASILFDRVGSVFPWSTFLINAAGAFLMGFLLEAFNFFSFSDVAKIALTFGFLGAFTTFSAYSWEVVTLFRHGYVAYGLAYVFSTNVVTCVLLYVGIVSARLVLGR